MSTYATAMGSMLPEVMGLAVRGLALLGVAGLLTVALRRSSAALRHLVWTTALAGVLALPALVAVLPDVGVTLPGLPAAFEGISAPRMTAASPGPGLVATTPARAGSQAGAAPASWDMSASPVPETGISGAAVVDGPDPVAAGADAGRALPSLPALLVAVWLAGVVAVLAPVVGGWAGVKRLEGRSRPTPDTRARHLATRVALRIGLRREFRLLEGPAGTMPMTWGIVRPVVVLPPEAAEWPEPRLEAVLLHELAHVKRRDCLTQLLAEIVRAVHWFDPLAWVAARRLRAEREHACDDVALAGGARPSEYASELLGLAKDYRASRPTTLAAVAMARPGQLAGRLLAVLDEGRRRGGIGRTAVARTAAALGALTLALAAAAPSAEAGVDGGGQVADGVVAPVDPGILPAPAVPPPATLDPVAPGVPAQEATCAAAREDWKSINHQSNDDRATITMRRPGCDLEVRLEGEVEFDADAVSIARLGRDARVRIEEDDGRIERYLEIRPGAGGAPSFEYRVDRRAASFDGAAQAWYRAVMLQLFRRAGFAAEERVEAMLRRGGVEAVLQELGQIESSYVFAKYTSALLEQARLGEAELRALVRASSRRVDSDHYMAEILGAVADHQPLTGGMLDDFIAATETLDSDHYRAQVLGRVLSEGRLSAAQASAVLASAAGLESDHYAAQVLKNVADRYALEPAVRQGYLRAAAGLESDHYLSEVLGGLLARSDLSAGELADVLAATEGIESDHYRSQLLKQVAGRGLTEEPLQRAYFRALAGIESDHYGAEALRALIRQDRLPADLLAAVLDGARGLESDHYLSELLVEVADQFLLQGDVRNAFLRAMDAIESDHYRGRVAAALLRAERR